MKVTRPIQTHDKRVSPAYCEGLGCFQRLAFGVAMQYLLP